MLTKVFEINLDLISSEYQLIGWVEVVSGDTNSNIFNINLLQNFVPVNASGNTGVIIFRKPDGTMVYQNLTIVDAATGKFTCTLSSQTIVVPGRIKAEVALYEGTKRVTSTRFEFVIRKALLDEGTLESSNEFSALTTALATVTQYDGRITTVEQKQTTHEADIVTDSNGAHGLKIESGLWTPKVEGTSVAGVHTYSEQYGQYYKVGNEITILFRITISAKDAAMVGFTIIRGLPFALANYGFGGSLATIGNFTLASGYSQISCSLAGNFLQLQQIGSGKIAAALAAELIGNLTIIGSAKYYI